MLILGVNAGGGDKDQENEIDKKTEVELDLALDRHFHIPHGLNLAPHLHTCFWRKEISQISANGNIINCILNSLVIGNYRSSVFCACGGNPVFPWQPLTCITCCLNADGTPG